MAEMARALLAAFRTISISRTSPRAESALATNVRASRLQIALSRADSAMDGR
jgi:hypothetical protein